MNKICGIDCHFLAGIKSEISPMFNARTRRLVHTSKQQSEPFSIGVNIEGYSKAIQAFSIANGLCDSIDLENRTVGTRRGVIPNTMTTVSSADMSSHNALTPSGGNMTYDFRYSGGMSASFWLYDSGDKSDADSYKHALVSENGDYWLEGVLQGSSSTDVDITDGVFTLTSGTTFGSFDVLYFIGDQDLAAYLASNRAKGLKMTFPKLYASGEENGFFDDGFFTVENISKLQRESIDHYTFQMVLRGEP